MTAQALAHDARPVRQPAARPSTKRAATTSSRFFDAHPGDDGAIWPQGGIAPRDTKINWDDMHFLGRCGALDLGPDRTAPAWQSRYKIGRNGQAEPATVVGQSLLQRGIISAQFENGRLWCSLTSLGVELMRGS